MTNYSTNFYIDCAIYNIDKYGENLICNCSYVIVDNFYKKLIHKIISCNILNLLIMLHKKGR